MSQADPEPVNLFAFTVLTPDSPCIALREFLAFKLGAKEYGSNDQLVIGSVQDRMLILLDIEKLMISAKSELVAQTLH